MIMYVWLKNITLDQTFIFDPQTKKQQKLMRFFLHFCSHSINISLTLVQWNIVLPFKVVQF